jgi:hypothetical protein
VREIGREAGVQNDKEMFPPLHGALSKVVELIRTEGHVALTQSILCSMIHVNENDASDTIPIEGVKQFLTNHVAEPPPKRVYHTILVARRDL